MTSTAPVTGSTQSLRAEYLAMTRRRQMYSGLLLVVFVAALVVGFQIAQQRNAGDFLPGLSRLDDFPALLIGEAIEKARNLPGHIWGVLPALIETVNIAAVATLLGVMAGALLSLGATPGLAPFPRLVVLFRRTSDIVRAIPEIVVALVLIFIMGGGPVPAMVAIALHTAGTMGKLFSEVNENVDMKPLEGLRSVGARWSQRMALGVLPQVAPNYLSYALLRFEINIRASAILGFVGAGGIGYELKNAMTFGQGKFDEAAGIFLVLFAAIVVFDQLSSLARNRLIKGRS